MAMQCKVLLKNKQKIDDDDNEKEEGGVGEKAEWRKFEDETKREQPYIEPWTPESESSNACSTAAGFGLCPPTCA